MNVLVLLCLHTTCKLCVDVKLLSVCVAMGHVCHIDDLLSASECVIVTKMIENMLSCYSVLARVSVRTKKICPESAQGAL